jgi:hypothetical protein
MSDWNGIETKDLAPALAVELREVIGGQLGVLQANAAPLLDEAPHMDLHTQLQHLDFALMALQALERKLWDARQVVQDRVLGPELVVVDEWDRVGAVDVAYAVKIEERFAGRPVGTVVQTMPAVQADADELELGELRGHLRLLTRAVELLGGKEPLPWESGGNVASQVQYARDAVWAIDRKLSSVQVELSRQGEFLF